MDLSAAAARATRDGGWNRALVALPAGALVALVTITYTMSYAALVFSGGLAPAYGMGLASMLVGCVLAGLITALFSSIPFAVSAPDSNVVAILAASLAPLAWQVGNGADPAAVTATALAAMALATLATGLILGGLGMARAGRLVRFVPFPIIAGFLGASGWFLLTGGARVATGAADLQALLAPGRPDALLAALAGGGVLLFLPARLGRPLALPALILSAILLHHAIAAGLGAGLAAQAAGGWLAPISERLTLPLPWAPEHLARVDWAALARHVADLPLLVFVATIGLLLNVTGLEAATGRDAQIDRELRVAGGAALATGVAGGLFGLVSPGRSLLLLQSGGPGRLGGIVAALLAGSLPLAFPEVLGLVPLWVLGAVLVFLGLDLLRRWILRSRDDLSVAEWLQVLAVAVATVGFGFLAGLIAGLVLACGHFIALYGRASPIRTRYDGTAVGGNWARSEQDRAALRASGTSRLVMHLQGFLFFGTANRLLEVVRAALAGPDRRTHLLLDFQEVIGLDGSAAMTLARLRQVAAAGGVQLVLTGLSPAVARKLGALASDPAIRRFASVQEGLEWMEEDALARLPPRPAPEPFRSRLVTFMGETDAARFLQELPIEEVPPGAVLMVQGQPAEDALVLEEGRVVVHIRFPNGHATTLRLEGPGTLIGELAFLFGMRRRATVTTETACRVRRLSRDRLTRLEREAPDLAIRFHRLIGHMLGDRLQDNDRLVASLVRGLRPVEDG